MSAASSRLPGVHWMAVCLLALFWAPGFLRAQGPNLPPGTRFIMSHFKHNGGGGDERLYISVSPNGVNWEALNNGNPVWEPVGASGFWNVVRDPSIVFANDWYWVAYTSGNYGYHKSFGLVKSRDLLNWTFVGEIDTAIPGAVDSLTWGPFFFKDADGSVHLFVSISLTNGSIYYPLPDLRTHELHPLNADFTQWSSPVLVQLPSTNTNEFWPWKEGDTYHAIYVDFARGGQYYYSKSQNLITGWQPGTYMGFGGYEGGFVLKKPEGGYRLYLEGGNGGSGAYKFYDGDQFPFFALAGAVSTLTPMRNGKIITAPGTTTFAQWQTLRVPGETPAQQAEEADPDGDGIPNLAESVTGTNPLKPNATVMTGWLDANGRFRATHAFDRSISGVSLSMESATTLPSWGAASGLELRSVTMMSDGLERWEWAGTSTLIDHAFHRLKATLVP